LRAAAPFQRARNANGRVRLEREDLRFKQLEQAPGVLTILVVDSSGSMALNRMDHAKGAAIRLLGDAYLRRDKVALVAFRGKEAELVVPPTRSPELAQRMLSSLPSGGGTPLASALETALGVAAHAPRRGLGQPLVVVLTDGRPNVSRGQADVWADLENICAEYRFRGIASAIIDTRERFLGGEAERIAALLGARYTVLPRPDAESIYRTVVDLREDYV
jgi:magnesium chelatase subunit D